MANEKKMGKRDQVKAAIESGGKTKIEIAEALGMSVASVSSQMTYLRWMGMFIIYDENKILSAVTEEEFEAWQEELKANRKTKAVSNKTPEEQAVALQKTIKTQNGTLVKWEKKLDNTVKALIDDPEDDELLECQDEASANITLLKIKIRRNEVRAAELPDVPEKEEEIAPPVEDDINEDNVNDDELL